MTDPSAPSVARPYVVLIGAGLLGLLGEALFSPGLLGLNVFLWTGALATAVVVLSRLTGRPLRGEGRWLLAPALLFAGFVAWRASPVLQAVNVGMVVVLLSLASFRMRDGRVRMGGVTEYLWLGLLTAATTAVDAVALVFRHVPWRTVWRRGGGSRLSPWLRATVIAVPLVLVFGGLMASADVLFSDALSGLFEFDLATPAAHLFRALLWTWVAAGFLHGTLIAPRRSVPSIEPAPAIRLGPIEVSTILGLLDLLFLAFVAFQIRYLFGGADHVEVTDGLTYAEYARDGFFELLAVAALVLPLVLGIHWLLRDSSPVLRTAFRVLAAALMILLYVVIASALQRMRVYVDEFGLTQLRLYSTAAILWLALVFAWLALTVLRSQRSRFAFGGLVAGLAVVAGLNIVNPDGTIVDTNLDRMDKRGFDSAYALDLSPDATPTLVAALPKLPATDRCRIAAELSDDRPAASDWRSWNFGREEARDLAGTLEAAVQACR